MSDNRVLTLDYEDTHVVPVELPGVDADAYQAAVIKDETSKPMRPLFNAPSARPLKRLIIHVADLDAPNLEPLLLKALAVTPQKVA